MSGEVLGLVRKRPRSAEFIEFLKLADARYPAGAGVRLVLDNHSAYISRETRAVLGTRPNREELKTRIELYLKEINETPVVFRW